MTLINRLTAKVYWLSGGIAGLALMLFFLWQPVIFWGRFSPGKGVRDWVTAGLPWLEPGLRRILFLPDLSKYDELEVTADKEWKNLLASSVNPLRYAELWLNQRALIGISRLKRELAEQQLRDIRLSVVVRRRPESENYDDRTAIIELASVGGGMPMVTGLKAEFSDVPAAAVILRRDRDGQVIGELKPNNSGDTVEMEIKDLAELINDSEKYNLSSETALKLIGVKILISNGVTGEKAGSVEAQLVDEGTFRYLSETKVDPEKFAANNREFLLQDNNSVLLPPGRYVFDRVVIVPSTVKLRILPGTTLRFMPGASLVSYAAVTAEGTASAPIRFLAANGKPWGVFAVVNTKKDKSILRHVTVEDAAATTINGIMFSGGFAAHFADVEIYESEFRRNHGDDGVNLKYAEVAVEGNRFIDNDFDGLDLDVDSGLIRGNEFVGNGNDGLDVSWNRAEIEGNVMRGNKDKCLSVGEKSTAAIKNNSMLSCSIGIAVKDLSDVEIAGNRIEGNKQGIAVYQKKEIFGGGTVRLNDNKFAGNEEDISNDQ